MKYPILSSLEYGKGKVLLFCSRFNNINTGNVTLPSSFLRRCLEWISALESSDHVRACVVVNGVDDGTVGVIDILDDVSIYRGELKDLSDSAFLSDFDCLVFHGLNNNLSPLVRTNVMSYVSSGGGVLFSDINVDEAYISIFSGISEVYSEGSGVNLDGGELVWTSIGKSNHVYHSSFSELEIPILNTILETGFGDEWSFLYVYSTDVEEEEEEEEEEEVVTIYSSGDYDIPGTNMMGYFSAIYEDGVFKIEC